MKITNQQESHMTPAQCHAFLFENRQEWFYSEIAYFESFLDSVFPIETPAHISGAAFALNRLFLIQQLAAGKLSAGQERYDLIIGKVHGDHGHRALTPAIEALVRKEVVQGQNLPRVYFPEIVSTPVPCSVQESPHRLCPGNDCEQCSAWCDRAPDDDYDCDYDYNYDCDDDDDPASDGTIDIPATRQPLSGDDIGSINSTLINNQPATTQKETGIKT